jgi:hypothetical protein
LFQEIMFDWSFSGLIVSVLNYRKVFASDRFTGRCCGCRLVGVVEAKVFLKCDIFIRVVVTWVVGIWVVVFWVVVFWVVVDWVFDACVVVTELVTEFADVEAIGTVVDFTFAVLVAGLEKGAE